MALLEEVILTVDEFEAVRLADLEGLYQEKAAERMGISRPTFGRIIESARHKLAEVLVRGKALKIEGGKIDMPETRTFECAECCHSWALPFGTGRPQNCPACNGENIRRKTINSVCKDVLGTSCRGRGMMTRKEKI